MSASLVDKTLQAESDGSKSWRSRSRSLNVYLVAFRTTSSALMNCITAWYEVLDVIVSKSDALPFDFASLVNQLDRRYSAEGFFIDLCFSSGSFRFVDEASAAGELLGSFFSDFEVPFDFGVFSF